MTAPTTPTTPAAHAPGDAELLLGRGWPDLVDVPPPDRRAFLGMAAAAVATDVAVRSEVVGVGGALLVAVPTVALLAGGRVPNRRAWPVLLAVPLLGLSLATRTAGWLLFLDVAAAWALLVVGASLARAGDPLDQSLPALAGRALHALVHGVLAPGFVLHGLRANGGGGGARAAVVRGILLGTPVVLVVGLLLGAADPVFASFFRFPADAGDLVGHAVLLGIGAWTMAALLRLAAGEPYDVQARPRRLLGTVEATTVLSGLVAVFAVFTVSQLAAVVGGDAYVRRTAGLSYAEYARSGFFPLLAAAVVTLGVLLAVRAATGADRTPRVTWLSQAAVALTLVLVAGAVRRLGLYERAYGLTVLRLLALLFALWIAVVFVLLACSLAGVGRDRAWFVPAALGIGVAGLLVLTAANPEAIIVRRNVDRLAGTEDFDPQHLTSLSDDAVPALLDALPALAADDAAQVRAGVCAGDRRTAGGPWAFNTSASAAADARAAACP
jgi:hypothetical protein